MSDSAFRNCIHLEGFICDQLLSCGKLCFYGCLSLKFVDFPLLAEVGDYCFAGCGLLEICFPQLLKAGIGAFNGSRVQTVCLQKLEELSNLCFFNCKSMTDFTANNLIKISSECFSGCVKLQKIDAPLLKEVGVDIFKNCTALSEITAFSAPNLLCSCGKCPVCRKEIDYCIFAGWRRWAHEIADKLKIR